MTHLTIDLHTHTLFSDGVLIPTELARRMEVLGYEAVALTDHFDTSRIHIIKPLIDVCKDLNKHIRIKVVPGLEITHVPPEMIKELVEEVRGRGIKLVVVHGETIAEPVTPGTNRAALEARVDILAHPGLLSVEDAELAAKYGVALEISTRKGHSLTNGLVAQRALQAGAPILINSDAHSPEDLKPLGWANSVGLGAGLTEGVLSKISTLAKKICSEI